MSDDADRQRVGLKLWISGSLDCRQLFRENVACEMQFIDINNEFKSKGNAQFTA